MKTFICKVCGTEWEANENDQGIFCPVCFTRAGINETVSDVSRKSIFYQVQCLLEHNKYKEAVSQLKRAISRNDEYAQYMLGECYNSGWGVDLDENKALELFLLSADQGYVKAQIEVARKFAKELDFESLEKAEYWFTRAYDQGLHCEKELSKVKKQLAYKYEFGDGVEVNEKLAFELFQDAANLDIDELGMEIPLCYFYGIGVDKDYKRAALIFDNLQEQGVLSSQKYLALCYQNGLGVEVNLNKAFDLYKYVYEEELLVKNPSVDRFDKENVNKYNEELFNQVLTQLEYEKNFVPWLEKAVKSGDKYAEAELGWYYLHKVLWLKKKIKYSSRKERLKYNEKLDYSVIEKYLDLSYMLISSSAEKGYRKAQYLLGFMLEKGLGVKKNLKQSKAYYIKAIIPDDTFAEGILSKPKFWFK